MPKKKTKNLYWTKETEQAVIDYNNTDDPLLKNQIFNTHLYKPLSKMTEIMIRKFGYFKLYNMKLNYDISDCIEDTIERAKHFANIAKDSLGVFQETIHKKTLINIVNSGLSRLS